MHAILRSQAQRKNAGNESCAEFRHSVHKRLHHSRQNRNSAADNDVEAKSSISKCIRELRLNLVGARRSYYARSKKIPSGESSKCKQRAPVMRLKKLSCPP